MQSSYNEGSKSVESWIKKHHQVNLSQSGSISFNLKEGNPSAASFMKFQAFTTAAVQDQRIRTRIQQALTDNLDKGQSKKDFAKVIDQEFDRAGLTRLNPGQISNIYYTNTSLAFGAGQMGKMMEVSGDFPYWKYSATMDTKTRPDHAALHGKIFRTGDFTFWPPIGFRCRCTAIPLTARQAAAQGGLNSPPSEGQGWYQNLRLSNAGFIGNKQQNYMQWIGKEYAKADEQTKGYIDKAFDAMRADIDMLNKESLQQFFGNEFVKTTWDKFRTDQRYTIAAQALNLSTKQAYYVHAYTQEAPLYRELNGWLFKGIKPNDFTDDQLLTMKRLLTNSLKKMPKYEGIVYRQVDDLPANILKQYKVGSTISWDGFSSASLEPKLAGFSGRKYTFIIHSKTSRRIESLSAIATEKETLLMPGKFKITNRQEQGQKIIIEMKEL